MEEKDTKYFYDRTKHLIQVERKTPNQAINLLIQEGLDEEVATKMVGYASGEGANPEVDEVLEEAMLGDSKESNSGVKDMLIGGLFCVGGTIATVADVGYIFWGAIVFGGIQFFRGLIKSVS